MHSRLIIFLGLIVLLFGQSKAILSLDSELKLITDKYRNLEGSSFSEDGKLYFVDLYHTRIDKLTPAKILVFNPKSNSIDIFASPSGRTIGTEFDKNGMLICAEFTDGGGRRITQRNVETNEAKFLAVDYKNKPFNGPNDIAIDSKNRIYFTDYSYTINTEALYHRFGAVYRIDTNGKVSQVIKNAGMPNGIAISPDQKTLYVGSNGYDIWMNKAIIAYNLDDNGEATYKEIFVDYKETATPDGMVTDKDGNLYVAIFRGTIGIGVKIYSPYGKEIGYIKTPKGAQNLTFGRGEYKHILYIVGQSNLYQIKTNTEGYHVSDL